MLGEPPKLNDGKRGTMGNREYWIKEARRFERKADEIRETSDLKQLIYLSRVIQQCWLNAGDAEQDQMRAEHYRR